MAEPLVAQSVAPGNSLYLPSIEIVDKTPFSYSRFAVDPVQLPDEFRGGFATPFTATAYAANGLVTSVYAKGSLWYWPNVVHWVEANLAFLSLLLTASVATAPATTSPSYRTSNPTRNITPTSTSWGASPNHLIIHRLSATQ